MKHNFFGSYQAVNLVPMNGQDSEEYRLLRNKAENRKWFTYSEEISAENQKKWFENYLLKEGEYMFSAFHIDNPNLFIGAASIYDIDDIRKEGEFGRIIVDKTIINLKGYGFMICFCTCQIAFTQMGLHKIKLEVYDNNIPAIRTYEKVGFKISSRISVGERTQYVMVLTKDNFKDNI